MNRVLIENFLPRVRAACLRLLLGVTTTAVLLMMLAAARPVSAQIAQGDIVVDLEVVASGLASPVGVTHAGDGSGRLFIVDQIGQIRIVDGGVLLAKPFLDITDRLPVLDTFFDERGLLGLAFHPDYATNGRFFVRYSAPRDGGPDEPCTGTSRGCHTEVLAEFAVSGDPDVADAGSESILFTIDEPQFNHNAGDVAFGPDGFLYFSLGDGGGAHDGLADMPPSHGPFGHGQNIETALGSMLRIDVDSQDLPLPYGIPADNPFANTPGVDEIYAYGLRNPYKFSFDDGPGGDGRLIVADVGQGLFEEIDVVTLGGNYGWVIREGFHCFDPFNPTVPPAACAETGPLGEPLLDPVAEYTHDDGLSIIGGYVYRGSCDSQLVGSYVCGDFAREFTSPDGRLFYMTPALEILEFQIGDANAPYGRFLKGFGEDEGGEIYVCGSTELAPGGTAGVVERLVPRDCPVPVELSLFEAVRRGAEVVVSWDVSRASDHAGFHVYRQEVGGVRERLTNEMLRGRRSYELVDAQPVGGSSYWLEEIALDGSRTWIGPVGVVTAAAAPAAFSLRPSRPNPMRSSTSLTFEVAEAGHVRVAVFDAAGRHVAVLIDGAQAAGEHAVTWDGRMESGRMAPAGVYLVRLETAGGAQTQKFVVTR